MAIETGDMVRFEYVGRLPDGTVFDTSREAVAAEAGLADEHPDREYEPIEVEVGAGRIVEGLEEALVGLEAEDTETVTIPPEKAYGESSEERVVEYDREEFERVLQGGEPTVGGRVQTQQGAIGEIVVVDEETVTVDFNHELADETLEFEIEILEIR